MPAERAHGIHKGTKHTKHTKHIVQGGPLGAPYAPRQYREGLSPIPMMLHA